MWKKHYPVPWIPYSTPIGIHLLSPLNLPMSSTLCLPCVKTDWKKVQRRQLSTVSPRLFSQGEIKKISLKGANGNPCLMKVSGKINTLTQTAHLSHQQRRTLKLSLNLQLVGERKRLITPKTFQMLSWWSPSFVWQQAVSLKCGVEWGRGSRLGCKAGELGAPVTEKTESLLLWKGTSLCIFIFLHDPKTDMSSQCWWNIPRRPIYNWAQNRILRTGHWDPQPEEFPRCGGYWINKVGLYVS